jgi:YfiH family protein
MLHELIKSKVYYKVFDKNFKQSSHIYAKYKSNGSLSTEIIDNNKKAILSRLNGGNLLVLHQIHSNIVIDADIIEDFNIEPQADGAVTTKQNIILSVQTADCVPVLLASKDGLVVGAAHCGWKSAKADIVKNLVSLMRSKGAHKIKAFIGPAIQQCSYEIDSEYYNNFIMDNLDYHKFFVPSTKENHYMFDLPSFVETKLREQNIDEIDKNTDDTYSQKEKYPSYRRSCHSGTQYNQNILSTIIMKH